MNSLIPLAQAPITTPQNVDITTSDPNLTPLQTIYPSYYLRTALNLLLGIAGVVSFVFLLIGSLQLVTAGGDKDALEKAKKRIIAALIGLTIVFSSYVFLFAVRALFNVDLIEFRLAPLGMVDNTLPAHPTPPIGWISPTSALFPPYPTDIPIPTETWQQPTPPPTLDCDPTCASWTNALFNNCDSYVKYRDYDPDCVVTQPLNATFHLFYNYNCLDSIQYLTGVDPGTDCDTITNWDGSSAITPSSSGQNDIDVNIIVDQNKACTRYYNGSRGSEAKCGGMIRSVNPTKPPETPTPTPLASAWVTCTDYFGTHTCQEICTEEGFTGCSSTSGTCSPRCSYTSGGVIESISNPGNCLGSFACSNSVNCSLPSYYVRCCCFN